MEDFDDKSGNQKQSILKNDLNNSNDIDKSQGPFGELNEKNLKTSERPFNEKQNLKSQETNLESEMNKNGKLPLLN